MVDHLVEAGHEMITDRLVTLDLVGVDTDDEPVVDTGAVAKVDFFDS